MPTAEQAERMGSCIQKAAQVILNHVNNVGAVTGWTHAVYDDRSVTIGNARLSKLILHLSDGSSRRVFPTPADVGGWIGEAQDVFAEMPESEWWYGILITVYPDGRVDVKFDYDRDCLQKMDLKS